MYSYTDIITSVLLSKTGLSSCIHSEGYLIFPYAFARVCFHLGAEEKRVAFPSAGIREKEGEDICTRTHPKTRNIDTHNQ